MTSYQFFSEKEKIRYSRQLVLKYIGDEGQRKLKKARVAVAGVGGLGGHIAVSLAGIGVGFLKIVDNDLVDLSNIHRQTNFETDQVDKPKVEVIQERIGKINPNVSVDALTYTINLDNATDLVRDVDLVVDGLDSFAPRIAINRASIKKHVPYIHAGVLETYGNVSTFVPGRTGCLECNMGASRGESNLTCERVGVLPTAVTLVASLEVNEAVNYIVKGKGLLENKLCVVDLSVPSVDIIPFYRNPRCSICSAISETIEREEYVVEACGKNKYVITPPQTLDLNLEKVLPKISEAFQVRLHTRNSISLIYDSSTKVTLMKTGNMLIRGAENREEALKVFNRLHHIISEI
ncbi:MAG: HesA/MoeB/ThiF family protein [Nitrososphaeria archaeon]